MTKYYLYQIPDPSYARSSTPWATTLEECLKRKEPIGVWTHEKDKEVFKWVMHPAYFMLRTSSLNYYAVIDEYNNIGLASLFVEDVLRLMDVIVYEKDNIPDVGYYEKK